MIDFESANKAALRDYAENELGVDLPASLNKDEMVEKIKELLGNSEVVEKEQPKEVTLMIPKMEGDTGRQPVFVNLNGRRYLIQRGQKVTVPYGVYEILMNAVERKYESVRDPETGKSDLISTEVQAYPVQVML